MYTAGEPLTGIAVGFPGVTLGAGVGAGTGIAVGFPGVTLGAGVGLGVGLGVVGCAVGVSDGASVGARVGCGALAQSRSHPSILRSLSSWYSKRHSTYDQYSDWHSGGE